MTINAGGNDGERRVIGVGILTCGGVNECEREVLPGEVSVKAVPVFFECFFTFGEDLVLILVGEKVSAHRATGLVEEV